MASKQISVVIGNKVMDTRLPQPAGCGDKYDVSGLGSRLLRRYTPRNDAEMNNIAFKGLDVVRQYAALLERRVQTGTRARKALVVTRQANPLGRSMIEMLGVLAIIGVLSVAGIAGYSKAMGKFKVNKVVDEVNTIAMNLQMLYTNQKTMPALDYIADDSAYIFAKDFVFPTEMAVGKDNGFFRHALNGTADLYNEGNACALTLSGLSRESCITLASYHWNISANNRIYVETAENPSDDSANLMDVSSPAPAAPAWAAEKCACNNETCKVALLWNLNSRGNGGAASDSGSNSGNQGGGNSGGNTGGGKDFNGGSGSKGGWNTDGSGTDGWITCDSSGHCETTDGHKGTGKCDEKGCSIGSDNFSCGAAGYDGGGRGCEGRDDS